MYGPPANLSSTAADREHLLQLLRNVSKAEQASAVSFAMQNIGFFLSRNVTLLYSSLLEEGLKGALLAEVEAGYEFMMNFAEIFSQQFTKILGTYRQALKALFEAVQAGHSAVDAAINTHKDVLLSDGFLAYLDAETADQEVGSQLHRFLVGIKLRLFSELEEATGTTEELKAIPRLAAIDDDVIRRQELMAFVLSAQNVSERVDILVGQLREAIDTLKQREEFTMVSQLPLVDILEDLRKEAEKCRHGDVTLI
jgi:hypothetical protein